MPRIERYTRGIVQPRAVADLVNPQAIQDAGAGYRAAAQITAAGAEIADKFVQAHELTATNEAIIKSKKQKMDFLEAKRQENMLNPEDFAKRIEPELSKLDAQMERALPTARAKKVFREKMMEDNFSIYGENFKWERDRRVENFAQSVENATLDAADLAVQYARQGRPLDDLLNDMDATAIAGASFLPPEKIEDARRKMRNTVTSNYIQGLIKESPKLAKERLERGDFDADTTEMQKANLITLADNMETARQRRIEEQKTLETAGEEVQLGGLYDRVFSGKEDPENLVLEIRKMEALQKIPNGVASDLVKVITAQKAVGKKDKPSEEQKLEFFDGLSNELINLPVEETLTEDSLKSFSDFRNKVYEGVNAGLITASQARTMIKGPEAAIAEMIKGGTVESGSIFPGIQSPVKYGLNKLKDSPTATKKEILTLYSDLMGKVDDKGNILPEGEYVSTGNAAADQIVLNRAINKAIEIYNSSLNPAAANAGANAVIENVIGTFTSQDAAKKAIEASGVKSGFVIINGEKIPFNVSK